MFASSKVSKSMIDAVNSVLAEKPVVEETKEVQTLSETTQVAEVAPPGFEGTVKAMKKHKDIDNPFALAWSMKNKGYKSHKKADGTQKNEEVENVEEALKGDQHKIDKNKNNKIDAHDFKLLRTKMNKEEVETVEEGWDEMVKDAQDKVKNAPKPNGGSGVKKGSAYGGSKQKDEPEVQKEGWDDMLKSVADKKKPQPNGGSGKKQGSSYGGSKQKDEPEMQKEAKTLSPGQDDAPFGNTTPATRVQELARTAMKRVNKDLKGKK